MLRIPVKIYISLYTHNNFQFFSAAKRLTGMELMPVLN
ncbi:hypothetical protein Cst_c12120 [Thermoclostridium stercorarium subsp. stercorarium DSM 8532]|uniref:Uncharacterized protein n=1 Tax=Thermoclostridium stercorarium (strain ATCC 35414 / DSM 8532 / NCIMB 11754) TaxID=1121335 RepID=L7VN82_THES1|nr:hypothetical protein Cst_c12120 [Thermoclostridium stercorarium subsp. stercorarium DSM 8532]